MAIFTGAGVAITTPFKKDGSVDYDVFSEQFAVWRRTCNGRLFRFPCKRFERTENEAKQNVPYCRNLQRISDCNAAYRLDLHPHNCFCF